MIYYIMGKSASGKDTLYKILLSAKLNLRTIPIYTTRPIRDGEKDGNEYHFVDEKYLSDNESKIIEKRIYNTVFGPWTYATLDDGNFNDDGRYLMIGTIESYKALKKYFGEDKIFPIYIEVSDSVRRERALKREKMQKNPKYDEMERRFKADNIDFSEEKLADAGITKRYNADDFSSCVNNIIKDIKAP